MALRRPPTRVELKADDIEEYNEIVVEREMAMEGTNTLKTAGGAHTKDHNGKQSRKQAAAERIGIGQPR